MAGSIAYMAPEQLQDRPCTASDQYALGVVVYEWLCGERPFSGLATEIAGKHRLFPPPSLCERVATIPYIVEQVVKKALAKDPNERFATVLAFASAFEKAYLIQLLQEMIEAGVRMSHADTPGLYMEVDTQQDFELAQKYWLRNS